MPYSDAVSSRVGWVVPIDRVSPRQAVALATRADAAGFRGVLALDLFQPWLPSLGQAPFVWNVLSAIGEHTNGDLFAGMAVPGYRLHPAALAQAAATLAVLNPGRVWLSVAPGEAINEHVTGAAWPEAPERIERMFEAVEAIRRLFVASAAGRDSRYNGAHVTLETARLWTVPEVPPTVLVATGGPATARRTGRAADGLLAVGVRTDQARRLLQRLTEGAESAGRDPGSLRKIAHLNVSWAPDQQQAVRQAVTRFPIGAMRFARGDLRSPQLVEQIAGLVGPEDLDERLLVSADPDRHVGLITEFLDAGYDQVYVHNVGDNHAEFIDMFASQVLPQVG